VDPDLPEFLPPGDMPARIVAACEAAGERVPRSRPALVRCVLDSLAHAYADVLSGAARLAGRSVDVVHLVGGGARNQLLCRLTAQACGVPVVAGPVEATALGNALVQAGADGTVPPGPAAARRLAASSRDLRRYLPDNVPSLN
jgi:rhamnulokinase